MNFVMAFQQFGNTFFPLYYKLVIFLSLFFILKTSNIANAGFTNHVLRVLAIVLLIVIASCKPTKMVPEGKYLLVKNKLKTSDSGNTIFNKLLTKIDDDKALYIKHKPNRRILILGRFHLGLYNLGSNKNHPEKSDSNKFRTFLRNRGEAPVLLDTFEILRSEQNLRNYLFSKGYFNCDITHSIKYHGKKATVTYYIIPKSPYVIDKVNLSADDAEIDRFLNENLSNSLLVSGQILDVDNIANERARLTNVLRNNGYFDFTKDYFDFELDTVISNHTVNINISVANKSENERFLRKFIRSINVVFENDSETHVPSDVIRYNNINFRFNGFPMKPDVIARNITFHEGDFYKIEETENTYAKISELPIFKFINITFVKSKTDSLQGLDAIITLKTNYRQSFTIEPQAIVSQLNRIQNVNYGNSYGVANSLIWTHRNLFKNAELFEISANTRLETQLFRDTNDNEIKYFNPAIQQSLNLSLSIPKSTLLSFTEDWNYFKPRIKSIKTNFNLSFLYEFNPDYVRRILPLTYQYQLQAKRTTWFLNLVEMSFSRNTLNINIDNRADSAFIRRLFANNLITATGLNFLYTDRNTSKKKTTYFIRTNVLEIGGNVHRGIRRLIDNIDRADTSYKLFDVNYFNYAKSEIDARCSTIIDENNSTAIRLNIGMAYPYWNEKVVPFDKLFFIGGANSLRAWRPRTVGPGAYYESSKNFRIDRAGDFIIQGNAEYRFDIVNNKLEGAVFVDAGNVWLIRDVNNTDPLKLFKPKTFISEIAANTGVGMRFDFQFFLFRLDWGMQIHNPEKPIGQTWVIKDFAQNDYFTKYSIVNFGIGYPF